MRVKTNTFLKAREANASGVPVMQPHLPGQALCDRGDRHGHTARYPQPADEQESCPPAGPPAASCRTLAAADEHEDHGMGGIPACIGCASCPGAP